MNTPSTEVGPGWWAFVAFFVLALALWLLMRNMFKRLRRMSLADRAEQQRQQDEERARREMTERAREIDLPTGQTRESAGLGDGPEEGQGRGDEV